MYSPSLLYINPPTLSRKKREKYKKLQNLRKIHLDKQKNLCYNNNRSYAAMAQLVEHILGKDEVISSNLISSSKGVFNRGRLFVFSGEKKKVAFRNLFLFHFHTVPVITRVDTPGVTVNSPLTGSSV